MILCNDILIQPTIFPDGTSQVWKLPDALLDCEAFGIIWKFEAERELFDLANLCQLIGNGPHKQLFMPYLPYARQDKSICNGETFSLSTFAAILNGMGFNKVRALDVHNVQHTETLINAFENVVPAGFHDQVLKDFRPDWLVFPDEGAAARYEYLKGVPALFAVKERDQQTGRIVSQKLDLSSVKPGQRVLMVDDICDGGATFLGLASQLSIVPDARVGLAVTHGIFSKGRAILENKSIKLYTTNSLLKNKDDAYEV